MKAERRYYDLEGTLVVDACPGAVPSALLFRWRKTRWVRFREGTTVLFKATTLRESDAIELLQASSCLRNGMHLTKEQARAALRDVALQEASSSGSSKAAY
ncbi:MAG TPA: hypothetical protein VG871_06450 [Vicinamibacterales bacterium]|nr:hypothetical protein [Vicinamibacterales bacterium]